MKFIKSLLEFNNADVGKGSDYAPMDFSPRRGNLIIIRGNDVAENYFNEAYRTVIFYLEHNAIIGADITPSKLMSRIMYGVDSVSSEFVRSRLFSHYKDIKISNRAKLIIDLLRDESPFDKTNQVKYDFLRNASEDAEIDLISDIIYLNDMVFSYEGFKFDLRTKVWTPSKDTKLKVSDNGVNIFANYDFQSKYLKDKPELVFIIPDEMLDDKIREEYSYLLQGKKFNL